MAFATIGCFGVGYIEILAATAATFVIKDQKQMGTPNGIFGSIRSAGGVLATTIYLAILTNRMTTNTASMVVPAVLEAGLPEEVLVEFLTALNSGVLTLIEAVPGVTGAIIVAGSDALVAAYTDAFQKVFLSSIAFGGLSIIAACVLKPFTKDELAGSAIFHLRGNQKHHRESSSADPENEAPLE